MRKTLLGIMVFSCVLVLAPSARAGTSPQPRDIDPNHVAIENLCDPEFYEESVPVTLDYQQLERVRIELLQRGFNPGFSPKRGTAIDSQLTEAVSQFQSEYHLPVTGIIEARTLDGLNISIQDSSAMTSELARLAKPSE